MRYLTMSEVLRLHELVIEQSGGSHGLRDAGALDSALAQPGQTFDGVDLHPSLAEKAAAPGFSLIQNHPFVDGNKRIGHAAIEAMLMLNGFELLAPVDESERMIMKVAAGNSSREEVLEWIRSHSGPV